MSQLGSRTYGVAYMLWVLAATGSPTTAGIVASVTLGAYTAAQLPAGWLTDRFPRRRVMVVCDSASALAALALFAVAASGSFRLDVLIAAGAVLGLGWAVRGTAETAALPHVVDADDLTAAAALVSGRAYAAGIAGPPMAGALFALSPALPFLADGISYMVAGGCAAAVREPLEGERTATKPASALYEIRAGLRVFWRERFIRTTAALDAATEFAVNALGLVVITMLFQSGAGASSIGVVLAMGSAGGLAGALLATSAARRQGLPNHILVLAPVLGAASVLSLSAAGGTVAIGLAYAAFFLVQPAWAAVLASQWLTRVDDEYRGRVQSAAELVASAPVVLTPVTAGLLLSALGPRTTCLVLAATLALVAIVAARLLPSAPLGTVPRHATP